MKKSLTQNQVTNDCINILEWFHCKNKIGAKISVRECSRDTGIPRAMLRKYIDGYKKWKTGEYQDWFLGIIAHKYSYEIKYLNNKNKLWVRYKHNVKNLSYELTYIGEDTERFSSPLVGLF